jgi:hypothetical protein
MISLAEVNQPLPAYSAGVQGGIYLVRFPGTDWFYLGQTENLYQRAKQLRSKLKSGTYPNSALNALYEPDEGVDFSVFKTDDRTHALALLQQLLDANRDDPYCLNSALDAAKPAKGLKRSGHTLAAMGRAWSARHQPSIE